MKEMTRYTLSTIIGALISFNAYALERGDKFDRIKIGDNQYLTNITIVSISGKEATVISDDGISNVSLKFFQTEQKPAAIVKKSAPLFTGDPLSHRSTALAENSPRKIKTRFETAIAAQTPTTNKIKAFGDLFFGDDSTSVKSKLKQNNSVEINGHTFTITPTFVENRLVEVSLIGNVGWRPSFHKTTVKAQWETLRDVINTKYGEARSKRNFFYAFELAPEDTRYTHLWEMENKKIQLGVGQKMEKYGMLDFESSFAHLSISYVIEEDQAVSQVVESPIDRF